MALIAFEKVVTLPLDLRNDLERSALVCLQDLDRDNWRDDDYGERRKKLCEWLGLLENGKSHPSDMARKTARRQDSACVRCIVRHHGH